jgi:hypothetical protein
MDDIAAVVVEGLLSPVVDVVRGGFHLWVGYMALYVYRAFLPKEFSTDIGGGLFRPGASNDWEKTLRYVRGGLTYLVQQTVTATSSALWVYILRAFVSRTNHDKRQRQILWGKIDKLENSRMYLLAQRRAPRAFTWPRRLSGRWLKVGKKKEMVSILREYEAGEDPERTMLNLCYMGTGRYELPDYFKKWDELSDLKELAREAYPDAQKLYTCRVLDLLIGAAIIFPEKYSHNLLTFTQIRFAPRGCKSSNPVRHAVKEILGSLPIRR